jgi:hypothetical protein
VDPLPLVVIIMLDSVREGSLGHRSFTTSNLRRVFDPE